MHIRKRRVSGAESVCGAEVVLNGKVSNLVDWFAQSDCDDCRAELLGVIHIRKRRVPGTDSVCGAEVVFEGEVPNLVDGAAQSNCDDCRARLLIAPVSALPVAPAPSYEPEPWPGQEPLEVIQARRDGARPRKNRRWRNGR